MKRICFLLAVVILGMLQVTLLDHFRIFGIKPDLLLIALVMASIDFGPGWALGISMSAGMCKDIFSAGPFGINTILFPLWGLVIVKLSKKISIDSILIFSAAVLAVSVLNSIVTRFLFLYSGKFIPLGIFLRILFLESAYTGLVSALFFRLRRFYQ